MTQDYIISSLRNKEFTDAVLTKALELTGEAQYQLFELAQQARHSAFPDNEVQVRSVIEIYPMFAARSVGIAQLEEKNKNTITHLTPMRFPY